jgi:hypothetical protein
MELQALNATEKKGRLQAGGKPCETMSGKFLSA